VAKVSLTLASHGEKERGSEVGWAGLVGLLTGKIIGGGLGLSRLIPGNTPQNWF
jgi:hypothetical protein